MKLYIPIAEGTGLKNGVEDSIKKQDIPIDIVLCASHGITDYDKTEDDRRKKMLECQVVSRNLMVPMLADNHDEYAAMQDRDIIHLYQDNFSRAIDFLSINRNYMALSLAGRGDPRKIKKHVCMQCFVFRVELFRNFKFRLGANHRPCVTMLEDINGLGYKYDDFYSGKRLTKEI